MYQVCGVLACGRGACRIQYVGMALQYGIALSNRPAAFAMCYLYLVVRDHRPCTQYLSDESARHWVC